MQEKMQENSALKDIKESPIKQRMSTRRAKAIHNQQGFREYKGPKLQGLRFVLDIKDALFPEALKHIPRPPKKIYGIGNIGALQEGLAIVGARKATPYGRECAKKFGRIAARKGIVIISGGARGCDSAAHEAALSLNMPTVVVFGGGCDFVYPAENYSLFQRVINCGGAVISENEWGFPAMPYSFRERNRIIAGLARATLIVEAGLPSGTFSTADEALAASKEVLAVPGAITSKTSHGSNRLIYQGATPIVDIDSFEDVLCSIYGCLKEPQIRDKLLGCADAKGKEIANSGEYENVRLQAVIDALRARPTGIDEMCDIAQEQKHDHMPENILQWLLIHLDKMERDEEIIRLPDGRYVARVK